ncbi:hypothetical protein MHU86_9115 [Fragilaria crotonensis]|nr:hypothetical protein MHU86_9115 [Fragilaria crotonensis]
MWLPVDPTNGIVNYAAEYFGHSYSPMPRFLQELGQPSQDADNDDGGADGTHRNNNNNKAILFLGDSHARYLHNQVSDIYYGRTQHYHGGGCGKYNPKGDDRSDRSGRYRKNLTRFRYRRICYGKDGGAGYGRKIFEKHGNHFDVIVVSIGQWDASRYDDSPSTPAAFLESLSILIAELEESAKPGVLIFVNTVIHSPMGRDMLAGSDWRVPPLIDMYNNELWNQVEQVQFPSIKNAKSFRFKNRSRTYLLDGTDILDPIWDSSTDFSHPCRYFVRPMAMQVLELFKDDL